MPGTARERLAELLGELAEPPASSVYRKLFMTDLSVAVDGLGPLQFPVSEEQAIRLRGLGHRARFGRGEQTLTDPEVRDTWEIPKDLVRIEWTDAFKAVLEVMRDELGLPPHCELTPDFHSMLLYETGQFFVTHQDSEKDDSMVGTLVVTLPSAHTGGELLIEHRGQTAEYRGSKVAVSLVAFYADCRHQVLPVKTGNRITLTYNLLLTGDSSASAEDTLAGELAACLDEHFATPVTLAYGGGQADPPTRLVYLLDHEYTARGLSWSRLKGADADRAALLRAAADRAGCDVVLALAEIQETWDAIDSDAGDPWHDYDYDDYEEEDSDDADDGQYVLQDLIDSSITLAHWVGPGGGRPEEISLTLRDAEVAATTPSAGLTPYASEYEGYMGNYGNTLDRWYRRAALVVWPRSRGFASRAQASSLWAMDALGEMVRAGEVNKARETAQSLEPFWNASVHSAPQNELLGRALGTAKGLDDAETAAMLLRPFQLERLVPDHVPALAALATHYGDAWIADLLRDWSKAWRPGAYGHSPELLEWLSGLPRLCTALLATGSEGTATARRILDLSWTWLAGGVRPMLTGPSTSSLDTWLTGLGGPLAGIIAAAAQTGSADVLDDVVKLGQADGDQVTLLVMAALRAAVPHKEGFDELALGCAERIRGWLARPQRASDDWSIELPAGCACDLCGTLGAFLRDPKRRAFEWPLAKESRRHVHARIDGAELPVRHETRRQGRPYTLVLTKTEALFEQERLARERSEADLAWLTKTWKVPV